MNILLINADQLRHDCVGYRKMRPVRTPNLDALASESVWYVNAFTPLPVCSPARQAILCGRRPDSFGAQWNYDFMPTPELDPAICWPVLLKEKGWNLGYVGRFHVSASRKPQDFGFTDFVDMKRYNREVAPKYADIPMTGGWLGCPSPIPLEDSRTAQREIVEGVPVLAEMLRKEGYETTCIGFEGNAGGRGYDNYIGFKGWGPDHDDGRAHKAQNLNDVAIPELERLAAGDKPFFLFMRHMDPHSPYLSPEPFMHMFFQGDAFDPNDKRMQKVYDFKPFGDYIGSWVPKGCTNPDYVIAQYDGSVAYMDACIQAVLEKLAALGLEEDTIVVFVSDHGETLYDLQIPYLFLNSQSPLI